MKKINGCIQFPFSFALLPQEKKYLYNNKIINLLKVGQNQGILGHFGFCSPFWGNFGATFIVLKTSLYIIDYLLFMLLLKIFGANRGQNPLSKLPR